MLVLVRVHSDALNMEVENALFVKESGLPRGHAIHFHVSSSESS